MRFFGIYLRDVPAVFGYNQTVKTILQGNTLHMSACLLITILLNQMPLHAQRPWPGEAWTTAEILTSLDPDFQNNMSGASWNPVTRQFWVCCNGGPSAFWALEASGSTFIIATNSGGTPAKFNIGSGDFEGVCQADFTDQTVFIITEGVDQIRHYDVSTYGAATLLHAWSIGAYVPTSGGFGSEGITFVPNEWLSREKFRDGNGHFYTATNGMDGIMLIAHQNGGRIYAFDLDPDSTSFTFVGAYKTSRSESSGLEFDRSSGLLHIWHNTGANYLEVTEIGATFDGAEWRLNPVAEFYAPKTGNLEGIAPVPASSSDRWCLIVDDDNQNGAALMWFKQYGYTNDLDGDHMTDAWELTHLQSMTNSNGNGDTDDDGQSDLDEYLSGTAPTNSASRFELNSSGTFSGNAVFSFSCSTSRLYSLLWRTNLLCGAWAPVPGQTGVSGSANGMLLLTDTNEINALRYYRAGAGLP